MGTREQIIDTANRLFYEHGYAHTSFASIAQAVGISRGNFYYYFKTKDEILKAVIEARVTSTREMLAVWQEESSDPLERVRRFVEVVITNQGDIESYGCPVGTLTSELAKLEHPSREHAVGVFDVFRTWLRDQFEHLGATDEADALAMSVLSFSQGVAALSNAFRDRDFVDREVARMNSWLTARISQTTAVFP